jgi:hypothetical protein
LRPNAIQDQGTALALYTGTAMNAGPVIAAIDLGPPTTRVLCHAAAFARLMDVPLKVLHVNGDTSCDTRERVWNACLQLGPYQVDFDEGQVIIRTGHVSGCHRARSHYTRRGTPRCQPGVIASAVLKTNRAFVLAVPNRRAKTEPRAHHSRRRLTMIAAFAASIALAGAGTAAQQSFADVDAIVTFQRAADSYAFLHRQVERRLGQAHRRVGLASDVIESAELAEGLRAERRTTSVGQFFTPAAAAAISARLVAAWRGGCDAGELYSGTWQVVGIGGSVQATRPVTECVMAALPHLPSELTFRSGAGVLILADEHADLVVDVLPGPLSFTSRRY